MCVCVYAYVHACVCVHTCIHARVCVCVVISPSVSLHRSEQLTAEIHGQTTVPAHDQIVFSSESPHFLSPQNTITHQHFSKLLVDAGASKGHALLYLLPSKHLEKKLIEPDLKCLSKLSESTSLPLSLSFFLCQVLRFTMLDLAKKVRETSPE